MLSEEGAHDADGGRVRREDVSSSFYVRNLNIYRELNELDEGKKQLFKRIKCPNFLNCIVMTSSNGFGKTNNPYLSKEFSPCSVVGRYFASCRLKGEPGLTTKQFAHLEVESFSSFSLFRVENHQNNQRNTLSFPRPRNLVESLELFMFLLQKNVSHIDLKRPILHFQIGFSSKKDEYH